MTAQTQILMKVPEFLELAEAQQQEKFQLAEEEVIMMPPDAAAQCGEQDLDSLILEAPLNDVEVTFPSSEGGDTDIKLIDYLSVPGIHHYLIIDPWKNIVVHHDRAAAGGIDTRIIKLGRIGLSPPGFEVAVEHLLGSR